LRFFKYILFVSLLVTMGIFMSLSYSVAQRRPVYTTPHRFEHGEELLFEAEFSRALLRNIDVADLKFHATRTPLDGASQPYALTFKADVTSKGFFARLFNLKFREQVESTVEPGTFTIQKTTILDEQGKRVRTTETTFDASRGRMIWTSRDPNNPDAEPRHAITEFSGQLQDVLSAIYFIRTQPLEVGKTFEVFIGDGGKVYTIPVKVVEKKRMKTILGRVDVLKVNPELFGPDRLIDKENGEFSIWITDDARHIPVASRVKTDYGTFDIKLKRIVNPTEPSAVAPGQ
jgi:hypothetical protein